MSKVVCDTGPLISLEKLDNGYGFIRLLYDEIIIPPAVLVELTAGEKVASTDYLVRFEIEDLVTIIAPTGELVEDLNHLDQGEHQAIRLAKQLNLPLLIEEQAGRIAAQKVDLHISGIAGQILKAARLEKISPAKARAMLMQLRTSGRTNREIFSALKTAVEAL